MDDSKYKLSISGLRLIFKNWKNIYDFMPIAFSLAYFFSQYLKKHPFSMKLAIANDSRLSGMSLKLLFKFVFKLARIKVIDYGCMTTPSFIFNLKRAKIKTFGLMITASHNPVEWNGIKFIQWDGEFVDQDFLNDINKVISEKKWHKKTLYCNDSFFKINKINFSNHVREYLKYFKSILDYSKIKKHNFYIICDTANGPVNNLLVYLFHFLNIRYKFINHKLYLSERDPEPCESNLLILKKKVKKEKADLGFAFDKDGDRLTIVSENGQALGEDYTLILSLYEYLSFFPSNFVINLSSSRMYDDLAKYFKVEVLKSSVGEKNVLSLMKLKHIGVGGEGNGGMILRSLSASRDPLISILLILNLLTRKNKVPISQVLDTLPVKKYIFLKEKLNITNKDLVMNDKMLSNIYKFVKEKYIKADKISLEDGIRVDEKNYWFHLRPSNTEPCIRLFIEGFKLEELLKVKQNIYRILNNLNISFIFI